MHLSYKDGFTLKYGNYPLQIMTISTKKKLSKNSLANKRVGSILDIIVIF